MSELIKRFISSVILVPLLIFCIIEGSFYFQILIIISFLIVFYEWNKMKKNFLVNFIGVLFLILSFSSIYSVRYIDNNDYFYFLLIVFICIFTDIGGYTVGKLVRGPKLTKYSPNKTFSGMIGSYVFSTMFASIFIYTDIFFDRNYHFNINILFIIISISTVSQFGDILISYFKRLSNVKDTGKLIPGHGGLLDRIDGMIFAFPFSYLLLVSKVLKF